jgi:hypothetical protein
MISTQDGPKSRLKRRFVFKSPEILIFKDFLTFRLNEDLRKLEKNLLKKR